MDNNLENNRYCNEEKDFDIWENIDDYVEDYEECDDDDECERDNDRRRRPEHHCGCNNEDNENTNILACPCGKPKGEIVVETLIKCNCLEPLAGARVNLYKINGCKSELIASKLSDCDGRVVFDELNDGNYRVVEFVDRCMFEKPEYCPYNEVKISACNRTEKITIINRLKTKDDVCGKAIVDVKALKCGALIPLSGIDVNLYKCCKGSSKLIATKKTDSCGTCTFDNIPEGDYRIAVKFDMCFCSNVIYDPSDNFSINCKEQCVETTVTCMPVEEFSKGTIEALSVLNGPRRRPIEGVKFNLYKLDGCEPELISSKVTNSSGIVRFEGLEHGLYKLIQCTPEGLARPIYIPTNEFVIDRKHRRGKCLVLNNLRRNRCNR
ncbi:MSCRAMM family protein [Clostridium fallax]|uniref:SpaA-like prealbumin fold domain-containing protein n=1 Tax=Clostridium fallax TaxID=1533 RepID=A0A1M4VUT7_9CLOT|nr:SpaA isopeptide-forming pilin-related protein [Clostridium fallax]SHE72670.1 hypothetical protein SAMN05443638_10931 [Clostridium fallax]SQB07703.1 CnaB domain-containing protein [Clostridium fallax]